MSELIDNSRMKKDALKHLILELHRGEAPEAVRAQLARIMGSVPYGLVVEVEQELIAAGVIPMEEILRLCDVHSAALNGVIDLGAAAEPLPGHPVDVFRRENRALERETSAIGALLDELSSVPTDAPAGAMAHALLGPFGQLRQVDRHYRRKENLLFPYLEKRGVNGPPRVMWGKDDEVRALLRGAVEALEAAGASDAGALQAVASLVLRPAAASVEEMIFKEEQILFPMCLDNLTEAEWSQIASQSAEIGWCLIEEPPAWAGALPVDAAAPPPPATTMVRTSGSDSAPGPAGADSRQSPAERGSEHGPAGTAPDSVLFPSGTLSLDQLTRVLNLLPFDLTFVDAEDRVRYFTQGPERIFDRNVAILGRRVQECHPPASVHIVQQILDDFHAGRADRAPFWIQLGGRFLHIEYLAVRNAEGRYLGTLEVSQDLTEKRALTGEQRLLTYALRAARERSAAEPAGEEHSHKPAAIGDADGLAASGPSPAWFNPAAVVGALDARPMLKAGEHPAGRVGKVVQALAEGQIFELITPFEPAPLIDKISAQGYVAWARHPGDGTVHTYFRRK